MPWEPEPYFAALIASSPAHLQKNDPEGLHNFIYHAVFKRHERRPQSWEEFMAERLDLQRSVALVYDRPTGFVFLGGFGDHQQCAASLYVLRTLTQDSIPEPRDLADETLTSEKFWQYGDQFIDTGMGFVCGGVSAQRGDKSLLVGPDVVLTPAEQEAFRDYTIVR